MYNDWQMSGFSDGPGGPPPPPGGGGSGIIGGLAAAGASIYNSRQANKTAKENTDKTLAANKAEAELAYQRAVEMWHMQNAYNDPAAQMARFKNAGLNPNLIYGQGNPGNASAPPQYQPPDMQHRYVAADYGTGVAQILPTLMSVGTWMQNMKLSEAEIDSKRTNIEKAEQLMQYLKERYPKELAKIEEQIGVLGYQRAVGKENVRLTQNKVAQAMEQFKFDWGKDLVLPGFEYKSDKGSGYKDVVRSATETKMQKDKADIFIKQLQGKLKEAETSFIDDFGFGGTPMFMQLVAGAALKMAGMQVRTSRPKSVSKVAPRLNRTITTRDRNGRIVKRNIYEK